ncbi:MULTISPECIES: hypothetical protein [unclassified Pseudoalteromonas]|uniref:hypothetical protein n=1 Tax=unclassified Pseudoalteromonas TaxID=194690 RepID=UPI00040700ED|nr:MULTISPECIES: hypothetical protein [unclassified Pseudoalteromonas]
METLQLVLQLLALIGILFLYFFKKNYFPKYLEEKAKNTATKEDIKEITYKVEEIKSEIETSKYISTMKYELKYSACLRALKLLDAHLSHLIESQDDKGETVSPEKQYSTISEARQCHNELCLTCESAELINLFILLMCGPNKDEKEINNLIELNKLRNLIRRELGFGDEISYDVDRIWFFKINCEAPC